MFPAIMYVLLALGKKEKSKTIIVPLKNMPTALIYTIFCTQWPVVLFLSYLLTKVFKMIARWQSDTK